MSESVRLVMHAAVAGKTAEEIAKKWLPKVAIMVTSEAKRLCPVDTGNLRASIAWEMRADGVYVGSRVVYAGPIEYGHSAKAPNGYLRPARDLVLRNLPA